VLGQETTVRILRSVIHKKQYESAYLFSGPSGTGKTTLGRIFANAILCERPVDEGPCGTCESCKLFKEEKHYGYKEMDAATYSGKEDIIALRDDASFQPVGGRKIILLDECHDISKQGQDALLKQVEECPDHLTYIFCTTDPDKMKETLRNRCMQFQVQTVKEEAVVTRLENICEKEGITFNRGALETLVNKAGGNIRGAIHSLEKASYFGDVTPDNVKDVSKNYDSEITDMIVSFGADLNRSLSICSELSLFISTREIYNTIISLLSETGRFIYGYQEIAPNKRALLEKIKDAHGLAIFEFLDYLIQRDKFVDKIGLQSDIVLLHYKFASNSFIPPEHTNVQTTQKSSISLPKKEEPQEKPKHAASELHTLDVTERDRILRQQRKQTEKKDDTEKQKIPTQWPLPKEERLGENSLDDEMLSPQEFSQFLVGGRSGGK